MTDDRIDDLLERYLDGSLTPEERRAVEARGDLKRRLADETALRDLVRQAAPRRFSTGFTQRTMRAVEAEAALARQLADARAERFGPSFQTRVMRRIAREQGGAGAAFGGEMGEMLSRLFPRVAVPALATACAVIIANVSGATPGAGLIEAMLGLPTQAPSELALWIWGGA